MKQKKVLNLFSLMMIASAFGISIRNLPVFAKTGMEMIFFGIVTVIIFYLPIALVSAELATGWPKMGGVAVWVKEAFGKKWGFVAIWLQWIYMNIGVIAMLYFISGTIAYLIDPNLVNNKIFLIPTALGIIWLFTYLNLRGLKLSSKISIICFIIGILLPAILLIYLGFDYFLKGGISNLDTSFTVSNLLPNFSQISTVVLLVGFMRAFGGIEACAVHANSVNNPKRNYPIAILFVVVLGFCINIFGSMSLGFVIPKDEISLIGGVMKAFSVFFENNNMQYILPILGILIALGQIGGFSTWIMGPIKGLLETAQEGELPVFFQKINKNQVPRNLMLLQAIIISISSTSFLLLGSSINIAFWISVALSMMVYFSMYVLMFLSAIYLRYKQPNVQRSFRLPFKNYGIWCISVLGILSVVLGFFIALFPPAQLEDQSYIKYISTLLGCFLLIYSIPFIIHKLKKESWNNTLKSKNNR